MWRKLLVQRRLERAHSRLWALYKGPGDRCDVVSRVSDGTPSPRYWTQQETVGQLACACADICALGGAARPGWQKEARSPWRLPEAGRHSAIGRPPHNGAGRVCSSPRRPAEGSRRGTVAGEEWGRTERGRSSGLQVPGTQRLSPARYRRAAQHCPTRSG